MIPIFLHYIQYMSINLSDAAMTRLWTILTNLLLIDFPIGNYRCYLQDLHSISVKWCLDSPPAFLLVLFWAPFRLATATGNLYIEGVDATIEVSLISGVFHAFIGQFSGPFDLFLER